MEERIKQSSTKPTSELMKETRETMEQNGYVQTSRKNADVKYLCKGKNSQRTLYFRLAIVVGAALAYLCFV